ncbi:hypothetical protein IV417_04185 [Alphaproteobacteria bacterium KMM 3653]|uniref:Type VI secretion system IcmF C-terminal domain-containing protein n=1 Tax=Harenicola maris TaxID=2841044 RepID=A0AAP2CMI8_9RHOB|nr:hypothetical protein [Harenicola maris]
MAKDRIAGLVAALGLAFCGSVASAGGNEEHADAPQFCAEKIAGKYPFAPNATEEVSLHHFNTMFAPGGLMDAYRDRESASAQQAEAIQSAFFPEGADTPLVTLNIRPVSLHAGSIVVATSINGQIVLTRQKGNVPATIHWPVPAGADTGPATAGVTLRFSPEIEGRASNASFPGLWGLMRFIEASAPELTGNEVRVRHTMGGRHIGFLIKAEGDVFPFLIEELRGFACPS